jgi:chromosome segregation ATPase
MRRLMFFLALSSLALPSAAFADLFKYTKKDGSVVYTENLAEVPADRREFYQQRIAEREAERRALESSVGKEELERREAEAERARIERQAADDAERAQRLAQLDAQLRAYAEKHKKLDASKSQWQGRMRSAKAKLAQLLKEFQDTQAKHGSLAFRASHTLLPGQAEQQEQLAAKLKDLEQQIDAMIVEVEETIPDEARKAGVPPGWIRD